MLKIGVLGAGHLGKIHLKLLQKIPAFQLVGFFDPDDANAQKVEKQFGLKRYPIIDMLIDEVDAVDIVTPTISHFDIALRAIRRGRHVFIEKPMTQTVEEARQLVDFVHEANVKAQVGHVERFNPAYLAVKDELQPMFVEAHRLATFNPRGTDVPVVLDLMVHDIDIILSLVKSTVKRVSASGVAVVSDSPDIANARIEFDNGCVANLTSSRISMKQMRKMRFFQKEGYISVDFFEKQAEIIRLKNTAQLASVGDAAFNSDDLKDLVSLEQPVVQPVNAIQMELELFAESILKDKEPPVSVVDGYNAIKIAHEILEKIEKNTVGK